MFTVSSVTYLTDPAPRVTCTPSPGDLTSQMMYLGSDVTDSRMSNLLSPCTWGYTSTLLRVTPPPRPNTWVQMPSLQGDPTSKTLTLVSLIHSLQGDPTSQTLYLELNFQFPEYTHILDPNLGSHVYNLHDESLPTLHLGRMSTSSRMASSKTRTGVTCLQSEA